MSPSGHAETITPELLRGWPLPVPTGEGADKSDRGSVLVVGGATRTPGAVLLAGSAALRAGAGKLQMAVAAPVAAGLAIAVPEALVAPLPCSESGSVEPAAAETVAPLAESASCLLLGPGLDDPDRTAGLLKALLPRLPADVPVVLDAYALGCLGSDPALADAVRGRLVLTPNTSEAARLLAIEDLPDDLDLVAARIAERFDACVALRGHIRTPDGRAWAGGSGSIGLGTSGSGDVLAGLLAGLIARGAELAQASCWASYVHAAAGDRLAARVGHLGFLAREVLEEAPRVLSELQV